MRSALADCARTRSGSVEIPRSTSQQSKGAGTAPAISCSARMRSKMPSAARATTAPPSTSLWPLRYFVVECTTKSAPACSGCCRAGVAQVPSTAHNAPAACAICATRSMSTILSRGLEGVSSHSKRVLGRSAACIFAGSPMSTRSTCNPHGCITSRSRRATPWYRSSCASTWSPGRNA